MKTILNTIALLAITSFAGAQVTSGLVANYSFNNGNANDDAGGINGTVSGASLTSDRFGNPNKAYLFNGNAFINCGNPSAVASLTTAYSISAWFKRSSFTTQYEVIAAKWDYTSASEHMFMATNNNHLSWATPGPGNSGSSDTSNLLANTWVHAVITWSTGGQVRTYINGVLSGSIQLSSYTMNITTPVNFMIGAQAATTRNFNGSIDDVKIYNRVLSPSEVTQLYNEANPVSTVGLANETFKPMNAQVFPNPSTGDLTIKANQPQKLKLINLNGQLIEEMELKETNGYQYTLNGLKAGVYMLVSKSGTESKKIIVTN